MFAGKWTLTRVRSKVAYVFVIAATRYSVRVRFLAVVALRIRLTSSDRPLPQSKVSAVNYRLRGIATTDAVFVENAYAEVRTSCGSLFKIESVRQARRAVQT